MNELKTRIKAVKTSKSCNKILNKYLHKSEENNFNYFVYRQPKSYVE